MPKYIDSVEKFLCNRYYSQVGESWEKKLKSQLNLKRHVWWADMRDDLWVDEGYTNWKHMFYKSSWKSLTCIIITDGISKEITVVQEPK